MNWKIFAGLIFGSILIRITGIISNLWLILGIVSVIWFWAFLFQSFPTKQRLVNWVFTVALIVTGGTILYDTYIAPFTKKSEVALERAKIAADLQVALKLNPQTLGSRIALEDQIQWLEDRLENEQVKELAAIRKKIENNEYSLEEAWFATETIAKREALYRENSKKLVHTLTNLSQPTAPAPVQTPTVVKEEERFYIAPPDKWSEKISIPAHYRAKIDDPEKKIITKSWNGHIYGRYDDIFEGDDIINAHYWIRSVTGKEEIIKVILRSKK